MPRTLEELREKLDELQRRDEEKRASILRCGADLREKQWLDLGFWAPDEDKAARLIEALTNPDYPEVTPVAVPPSGSGDPQQRWVVGLSIYESIEFITEPRTIAVFLLTADEFDCEYDGWGAEIVKVGLSKPHISETS